VQRCDPLKCPSCQGSLVQEDDVLDTWFSSALWPFSTLGWPEHTPELSKFYPTSVLVTGFDILFFWVARMMMMGLHCMKEVPFKDIYIHALVRDEQGQKMSKSTGNVIDPLVIIEKYGADALRFTLAIFAAMGRDVKLSESRIEGYKHFINKIWNTARFVLLNLEDKPPEFTTSAVQGLSHRFVFHELELVKKRVAEGLEEYRFNDAAQILYQFIWHTYCDWYLEMIKTDLSGKDSDLKENAQACLYKSFTEILILLHPFVPFVTQEIWSFLPGIATLDLSKVAFPQSRPEMSDENLAEQMDFFKDVVVSVRNIRSELNINPGQKLDLLVKTNSAYAPILQDNYTTLLQLARLNTAHIQADLVPPQVVATAVVKGCELFVPLEGVVDFQSELKRLDKQLQKVTKELSGIERKLANENFLEKAPHEVVASEKAKQQELKEKKSKIFELQEKFQTFAKVE
jgi:valyl-tRNA synthetase